MFTAVLTTTLFALVIQTTPNDSQSMVGREAHRSATWQDVEAYLDEHATQRNSTAEALMESEAANGQHTWVRITSMSGGGADRQSMIRPDGCGVGWPSQALVVKFATVAEMHEAADLIEEVAAGQRTNLIDFLRRN